MSGLDLDGAPASHVSGISYTISQDLGTEESAQHDHNSSMNDNSNLRSDDIPDDHKTQAISSEQDNKSRLLTAREEQEIGELSDVSVQYLESPFEGPFEENMDRTSAEHEPPVPKRRKLSHMAQDNSTTSNAKNEDVNGVIYLYRLECWSDQSSHDQVYFRDPPTKSERHYISKDPVYDINDVVAASSVDIIVVVDYVCASSRPSTGWSSRDQLLVVSPLLKAAISSIARCHYAVDQTFEPNDKLFSSILRIEEPDRFLFMHRHSLQSLVDEHPQYQDSVKNLLDLCNIEFGRAWLDAESLMQCELIDNSSLRYLFQPNEILVAWRSFEPVGLVLKEWPSMNRRSSMTLQCWFWSPRSQSLQRETFSAYLDVKDSVFAYPISDLAVLPLRFASPEIAPRLMERGSALWDLLKNGNPRYLSYTGPNVQGDEYFEQSRFIIDYFIYVRDNYKAEFSTNVSSQRNEHDFRDSSIRFDSQLNDDALLLLPIHIHGFDLTTKEWYNIWAKDLTPIQWNKTAFDRLVLPRKKKELVRALIEIRSIRSAQVYRMGLMSRKDDVIAGKGKGLIILLHGGPGTGKTLTAESLAEIAEMPLYRVTCGNIGTEPEQVEKYLNSVLSLGKRWNYIVLLDDADVFLEQRSLSNLVRNSLVAVFLRVLEYYDGIFILTSNRIGTFDEAFKSRIQVALHYEDLNKSSRKRIWENLLDMMQDTENSKTQDEAIGNGASVEQNEENTVNLKDILPRLDELASHEMNGREIRNTFNTACQLALHRQEPFDWKHLEQALSVATEFNKYIEGVHGHDDEQWLRSEGVR